MCHTLCMRQNSSGMPASTPSDLICLFWSHHVVCAAQVFHLFINLASLFEARCTNRKKSHISRRLMLHTSAEWRWKETAANSQWSCAELRKEPRLRGGGSASNHWHTVTPDDCVLGQLFNELCFGREHLQTDTELEDVALVAELRCGHHCEPSCASTSQLVPCWKATGQTWTDCSTTVTLNILLFFFQSGAFPVSVLSFCFCHCFTFFF